jgi:hypothetical protein
MNYFKITLFFCVLLTFAKAEISTKLATARVEIDDETILRAPWLNTTDFIVIRSPADPALKWIEELCGKKFDSELKKGPLLVYNGFTDAEYFVSKSDGGKVIYLNIDSIKHRDIFTMGLMLSVAPLPSGDIKFYKIKKTEEDLSRLGIGSGSGFGSSPK